MLAARAYLCRAAEPAHLALALLVDRVGPVEAADRVHRRDLSGLPDRLGRAVLAGTEARHARRHPEEDLAAARELGIDFVVPEDARWPHFAFSAFRKPTRIRAAQFLAGDGEAPESGELVAPLGLWVRGSADVRGIGCRSVAIVGSRSASPYGERVASDLAHGVARRGVQVVSGGAYGIDAAAHRGALAAGGETILVSAGGLDRPYPPANARLFSAVAECGLLVSESPPGSAPQRHRFLSRNRLIAALGTATLVVEAARRSGAINTAAHCVGLERQLLAVPGPITSAQSAGCHHLIARDTMPARLISGLEDLLMAVGEIDAGPLRATGDRSGVERGRRAGAPRREAGRREQVREILDRLDPTARRVYDGLPARDWADPDSLAIRSGVPIPEVLQAVPELELVKLVQRGQLGIRRLRAR